MSNVIYCYKNKKNGKCYIGFTSNFGNRRKGHLKSAISGKDTYYFHNILRKIGENGFKISIIESDFPISEWRKRERYWIKKLHTWVGDPECNGYNLTKGGEGALGYKWTKEQLSKLQRIHSKDSKIKMSQSHIGLTHSSKTVEKMISGISRKWLITFPNGKRKIIKNLSKFCRENGLSCGNMSSVAKGRLKHHKYFHCSKVI